MVVSRTSLHKRVLGLRHRWGWDHARRSSAASTGMSVARSPLPCHRHAGVYPSTPEWLVHSHQWDSAPATLYLNVVSSVIEEESVCAMVTFLAGILPFTTLRMYSGRFGSRGERWPQIYIDRWTEVSHQVYLKRLGLGEPETTATDSKKLLPRHEGAGQLARRPRLSGHCLIP